MKKLLTFALALLMVAGCSNNGGGTATPLSLIHIFGTHNLHRLPQLLTQAMLSHERTVEIFSKEGEVIENLPVRRFGKHKAWVNICLLYTSRCV